MPDVSGPTDGSASATVRQSHRTVVVWSSPLHGAPLCLCRPALAPRSWTAVHPPASAPIAVPLPATVPACCCCLRHRSLVVRSDRAHATAQRGGAHSATDGAG